MNTSEIIKEYIQQNLLKGRVTNLADEDDLLDSGILNSLGILQLVTYIDERFGFQVPDEDVVYENFNSVEAITRYLAQQQVN